MAIVIHGATSFLGKHFLRRLLAEGEKPLVIARESSKLSADVLEGAKVIRYNQSIEEVKEIPDAGNISAWFDFSWAGVFGSERNNPGQISVNIPMTIHSVQAAVRFDAKHWIGIGSQAEYGNLDKRISEKDECHPTTLYGKSKLWSSQIAGSLCEASGLDFSWLRLFSVYGPDDNHQWLIPYLIGEFIAGREVNVTRAEQKWDYLFISDVVEVLYRLRIAKGIGITNLGSGKAVQVRSVIEHIREFTGSSSRVNFGAVPYRPDQVMFMEADNSRLCEKLNWQPMVEIEEGLRQTVQSFQKA